MTYFKEFMTHRRPLFAATLGMTAGYGLTYYTTSIFIPPMMKELGWTSASVAMLGVVAIFSAIFQPIAGRFADRFGVRTTAAIGIFGGPLIYFLMSLQQGPFWQYFLLTALLVAVVSTTTSVVVYSRLVAQSFSSARGVALSVISCAPSIAGAIAAPLLAHHIDAHGWRSGYQIMAFIVLIAGIAVLFSVPPFHNSVKTRAKSNVVPTETKQVIWGNPVLKWILGGVALATLSLTLQTSQLKVVLLGIGVEANIATSMVSLFAIGVLIGRIGCGLALDFLPTAIVSALSLMLPGIGLLVLAQNPDSIWLLGFAVMVLGASLGAEGDVVGFAVMKYFHISVYSTVLGLVISTIALSATVGALILSVSLKLTDSYQAFLIIAGIGSLLGGLLMLRLSKYAAIESKRDVPDSANTHASMQNTP